MAALTPALALYSLEMLLLVATAAAAALLIRVPPRGRLIFWRCIVVACLLLPLAPARVLNVDLVPTPAANDSIDPASSAASAPQGSTASVAGLVPWILLAGVLVRSVWLAVGLFRLRALRRRAEAAVLSEELRVLKQTLAPQADVSWHEDVRQPVTFGMRRPVVLLPLRLRNASPDLQRAVVCHELVHVDRGDWAATVIEELILTTLWFHPAMWWAIGQIQLNREATVDARVVDITGSRRAYMEALLAFVDAKAPALAPVFARRRQIVVRMRHLSQDVVMSPMRLTLAGIALAGIVVGSGWTVVSAVPMRTEVRYRPVDARPLASHPQAPRSDVILEGGVVRIRTSAAAVSVAQNPRLQPPPPPPPPPPPADGKTDPRVLASPKPPYPAEALPNSPGATVWVSVKIGASGEVTEAKAARWQLTIDHSIDDPNYWASKPERAFVDAAEASALQWKFAPPDAKTRTQVDLMFTFRNVREASSPNGVIMSSPFTDVMTQEFVRVGGDVKPPTKISDVKPAYPEDAKAARVQGVVILELRIGPSGSVVDARVLRSIPMLDDAALTAVRQWRFTPTLQNGGAVGVMMTVTVNFILPPA